jgi:hypothetical protein
LKKAPADVVAKVREKHAALTGKAGKLAANLNMLKEMQSHAT